MQIFSWTKVDLKIQSFVGCVVEHHTSSYPVRHPYYQKSVVSWRTATGTGTGTGIHGIEEESVRARCTAIRTYIHIYIYYTHTHNTTVALLKLIARPPACLLCMPICLLAYRWSSSYMQCNVLYSLNKKTEWIDIEHILVGNLVEEVSQSWTFESSQII